MPNHNDIQGVDGGEIGFKGHLTRRGASLVAQMETRAPDTPENIFPAAGELNVDERPMFESSAYFNVHGLPWYGYQIEISDNAGNVVFDSGNIEIALPIYRLEAGVILAANTYTWRVRYQGGNLLWSDWSTPTEFTTEDEFEAHAILEPDILFPGNGTVINNASPIITTAAFDEGSGLTQVAGDFQISTDPAFSTLVEAGTGLNSYAVETILSRGVTYYVRARHKGEDAGGTVYSSRWSPTKNFAVRQLYRSTRIGIVWDDPAAWSFKRIGDNFEPVELDADYFPNHPVWAMLESTKEQLIDGQAMSSIMRFWIYSGTCPSGPYQGKRVWLIDSNRPTDEELDAGWHVHGAFVSQSFGEQDVLHLSRSHIQIVDGVAVAAGQALGKSYSLNTYNTAILPLNSDAADPLKRGWHAVSYIEHEAFVLLMMIEFLSLMTIKTRIITAIESFHGIYWGVLNYNIFRDGIGGSDAAEPGDDTNTRFAYTGRFIPGAVTQPVNDLLSGADGPANLHLDDYFIGAYRTDGGVGNATDGSTLFSSGSADAAYIDALVNVGNTAIGILSVRRYVPGSFNIGVAKLAKRT